VTFLSGASCVRRLMNAMVIIIPRHRRAKEQPREDGRWLGRVIKVQDCTSKAKIMTWNTKEALLPLAGCRWGRPSNHHSGIPCGPHTNLMTGRDWQAEHARHLRHEVAGPMLPRRDLPRLCSAQRHGRQREQECDGRFKLSSRCSGCWAGCHCSLERSRFATGVEELREHRAALRGEKRKR